MATLADLNVNLTANTAGLEQGLERARSSASGLGGGMRSSLGGMLAFAAGAAALVGVSAGFAEVAHNVVSVNSMIEQANVRFTTLYGSSEKARAKVAELVNFSRTTPFDTSTIIAASEKMQLLGGTTFNTTANLRMLGNIASATGQPLETVTALVGRMYSQIQDGLPINSMVTRLVRLGVIMPDVGKKLEEMQKQGASATTIWNAFTHSMDRFNGAMDAQQGTWQGLLTSIHRNVADLEATAFKPFFTMAENGLHRINSILASPAMQKGAEDFARGLSIAIQAAGRIIAGVFNFLTTSSVLAPIRDALGKIAGFVGDLFTKISGGQKFFDAFLHSLNDLGDPGKRAADVIRSLADAIAPRLSGAVNLVLPALGALLGIFTAANLLSGLQEMAVLIPKIARGVSELAAAIAIADFSSFALSMKSLGLIVAALGGPITVIVGAIFILGAAFALAYIKIEPFRNTVNAVVGAVVRFAQTIAQHAIPAIELMARTAGPILAQAFGQVLPAVGQLASLLVQLVVSGATPLIRGLQSISNWLLQLHGGSQRTVSILGILAGVLAVALPRAIATVVSWVVVALDQLGVLIRVAVGAANVFADIVAGNIGKAGRDITSTFNDLGRMADKNARDISTAWSNTSQMLDGTVDRQVLAFGNSFDATMASIGGAGATTANSVSGNMSGMATNTVSKTSQARAAVYGMVDDMTGKVIGMGPSWSNAGANAVQGLIDGMNSKRHAAAVTAAAIAADTTGQVVRGYGVQSPSRVWMQIGLEVVSGLIIGMARVFPSAVDLVRNWTGAINNSAQTSTGTMLSDFFGQLMTANIRLKTQQDDYRKGELLGAALRRNILFSDTGGTGKYGPDVLAEFINARYGYEGSFTGHTIGERIEDQLIAGLGGGKTGYDRLNQVLLSLVQGKPITDQKVVDLLSEQNDLLRNLLGLPQPASSKTAGRRVA